MNQNLAFSKISALFLAATLGAGHLFVGPPRESAPRVAVHRVETGLKVGMTAPDFRAQDLDGRWVQMMPYRKRGETVLLVFFPASADGSAEALRNLNGIENAFGAISGFHVIGIGADEPAALRAFARRGKLAYPVLIDADRRIHRLYEINPASTAYVLIGGNGAMISHPRVF
jgi:peroxiredoxin